MEAQQQQQQPQQQYQYHYQTQNDPLASAPISYDPAQVQGYDQSTQAYYTYHYPHQQQQDYSSYYYPDYSNSYQSQYNDPNSIHPPGVPIPADSQQPYLQNPQNAIYQHGVVTHQPPPPQGYMMSGLSAHRGGANHAGRSMRGSGRGAFGRQGRGRGGGRGKHVPPGSAPAATDGEAAPCKPPPQMAWCELCRVDCNTLEILEQHKNGKRHKRNLKVYDELQTLSKQYTVQKPPPQMPLSQSKPDNVTSKKPDGSETAASEPVAETVADKPEPSSGAIPSEEPIRKDPFGGRGGLKRRMRGGRGGKWMRAYDGSRKPVEPPKPKQVVPLICDLCNVKCESQVVFESHLVGKKHLSNVKRFQGHKKAYGEGINALYPTIPNLPSTSIIPQANQLGPQHAQYPTLPNLPLTTIIPQPNQQGPHDAQALASMMLSQHNLQDPQAAQAALTQLLNQHGIHDAQTLITQLVPYLLAQFQVPGSVPVPITGLGAVTQNSQIQGPHFSTGGESQNVGTENKTEQQNVTANGGTNEKPNEGKSSHPQVEGPSENNNAGAEQVIPAPAEEGTTVTENDKPK